MGRCRQLPASYWMNVGQNKMTYVITSTKSASDLSSYILSGLVEIRLFLKKFGSESKYP